MANSKKNIEYEKNIKELPLKNIVVNPLNPRQRFVESEEQELIDSIIEKTLLNPIIVYHRQKDDKYVILDGERRFRAFTKLKRTRISSNVLMKEPTTLENLSLMFHIHNVREEWTDFSIAHALAKVIKELNKDIKALQRQDKLDLSRITSLSEYKINKYILFFQYPDDVIEMFLKSELKEKDQRTKGMDPDILAEMYKPIQKIQKLIPEFFKKYSIKKIIQACIKKKAKEIIKTNRDFRLLTKSLIAAEKGNVRKEVMFEKLEEFVNDLNVTPQVIFQETSEAIYQVESILKKTNAIIKEVEDLNLKLITTAEKLQLETYVSKLTSLLTGKLSSSKRQ